ncbi:unnamed protein product [Rotaria sp. Silwood2]|nr:unnamed protein product [Rotaria sp. Silwood2]
MYQPKKNENIAMNESEGDSVQLPNILKWKVGLIIENDLRFDPASCGSGLFISDENTHLRKIVAIDEWRTYRIMNTEWTEGIHYWSMRINDRGPDGTIMIGIVTKNFDTGSILYPGNTSDSYSFYVHNGNKYNDSNAAAFTTDLPKNSDVIGVLLDFDARTLTYFKNGQIVGTAYGQLPVHGTDVKYFPAVGFYKLGQWKLYFLTGTITQYDILRVFPFQDNIFSLSVPGSYLANVLSCGMSMKGSGTFLAICGIETLDQGKTWLLTGIDI